MASPKKAPSRRRLVVLSLALVGLLAAAPALSRENFFSEGGELEVTRRLPEFPTEGVSWIGTEPLTLEDLRGRVWVLKVWTFGCVNCVRSIPYSNELMERFGDQVGVLGIHSPEFDWERDPVALEAVLKERNVRFPSMIDERLDYFMELEATGWPLYYVVDQAGEIRGTWVGEVHGDTLRAGALEDLIVSLLDS